MAERTLEEHIKAIGDYLPGGRLFSAKNITTSNLYLLLKGLGSEMLRADNLMKDYTTQIIPDLTEDLVSEWESAVGIPDSCFDGSGNLSQRRTNVLIKLASLGAQTEQDFQDVVDLFTADFTITQGVSDLFTIEILNTGPASGFPFTFPITFELDEITIAECLVNKMKPANCRVISSAVTSPWDLTGAVYDSVSFDVSTQDTTPVEIFFKPDGLKMYMLGGNVDRVYQYSMSTAWDVSTLSYDSVSFSITTEDSSPSGLFFKDDGTKMYMCGSLTNSVHQYTLSTPWDLSTASYDSVAFSMASEDTNPSQIHFKPDGLKMYMNSSVSDDVFQYSLSSAWDISTLSYDSVSFSMTTEDTVPTGLYINPDGDKMFMVGATNDAVYQYSMSTPWDLSTASYDSISFSVATEDTFPFGVTFKPNGVKMYITGNNNDTIYQYTL